MTYNHSHATHHTYRRRLKRWQKNLIHVGLISCIVFTLWLEGGKVADWTFLALAIATELS